MCFSKCCWPDHLNKPSYEPYRQVEKESFVAEVLELTNVTWQQKPMWSLSFGKPMFCFLMENRFGSVLVPQELVENSKLMLNCSSLEDECPGLRRKCEQLMTTETTKKLFN